MKVVLFTLALLQSREPARCLFGENFYEVSDVDGLWLSPEQWLDEAASLQTAVERAQLVRAVQQSSSTPVRSVAGALEWVDDHVVRRFWLLGEDDTPRYVVYEYAAGDHSYAAFFAPPGREVLARAYDGDIRDCRVRE